MPCGERFSNFGDSPRVVNGLLPVCTTLRLTIRSLFFYDRSTHLCPVGASFPRSVIVLGAMCRSFDHTQNYGLAYSLTCPNCFYIPMDDLTHTRRSLISHLSEAFCHYFPLYRNTSYREYLLARCGLFILIHYFLAIEQLIRIETPVSCHS